MARRYRTDWSPVEEPAQFPSVTFVQSFMDWLVLLEGTEMNVHRAHRDEKKMFTEKKKELTIFFYFNLEYEDSKRQLLLY